jgi:hypothetical protein
MKSKFICVSPISYSAKVEFEDLMDKFHSCRIIEEFNNKILLESLKKTHYFWISTENDKNWKVVR